MGTKPGAKSIQCGSFIIDYTRQKYCKFSNGLDLTVEGLLSMSFLKVSLSLGMLSVVSKAGCRFLSKNMYIPLSTSRHVPHGFSWDVN